MTKARLSPADFFTLTRLGLVPVLWALAVLGMPLYLGVGLAVAGLTDILDGPVARLTKRSSRYGAQLDSLADILLMSSVFWWLVLLRPEFFRENAVPLAIWAVIGSVAVIVTLVKFGRMGNLHLYSAKAAGVAGHVFSVWLLIFGSYSPIFFDVAITLALVASTETLMVALSRNQVNERIGSILFPRR